MLVLRCYSTLSGGESSRTISMPPRRHKAQGKGGTKRRCLQYGFFPSNHSLKDSGTHRGGEAVFEPPLPRPSALLAPLKARQCPKD